MRYKPHHTAISVRNLDESLEFYAKLGFKEVHRYDDPDKTGVKLKLDDYVMEVFAFHANKEKPKLLLDTGNNLNDIGVKHFGLSVDDVEAALADMRKKGLANDKSEILAKGSARFFFIQDPDGMWVEFIRDDRY